MKSEVNTIQLQKTNEFQRLLAILLSFIMIFSLCGTELISVVLAAGNTHSLP